jgi:hypothetical protein
LHQDQELQEFRSYRMDPIRMVDGRPVLPFALNSNRETF